MKNTAVQNRAKILLDLWIKGQLIQTQAVETLWPLVFLYLQTQTGHEKANSFSEDTPNTKKNENSGLRLFYFNARWYDPTLGRFICSDPMKDNINWYVYCSNNPITRTDPSGLAELDEAQTITNDTNKDSKIDDLFKNAPLIPDAMNCIVVIDGKIAFDPSKFNEGLKKIKDKTPTLSVGTPPVDNRTEVEKYVQDTLEQVIKGNYTDKNTLAGNIIMILAGLIDIDIPADIRDTIYDVTHFEANLEKLVSLGLDIVGFLPLIGAIKNIKHADEIVEGVQNVSKRFLKNLDKTGNELLNVSTKTDALASVKNLPANIQQSIKNFFKGGSNAYSEFSVLKTENGYLVKMVKPGNVPGSKAIYYKEIGTDGSTLRVFKNTFDPAGNLIHTKDK